MGRNTDPLHQRARAKALHMLSTAQWKAYYERSQAYDNYVQWRFGKSIGKWWYGSPSLAKVKEWFLKCSAGAIETIKHGQFLFGVTKSVCSSARVAAYVWGRPSNPSALRTRGHTFTSTKPCTTYLATPTTGSITPSVRHKRIQTLLSGCRRDE